MAAALFAFTWGSNRYAGFGRTWTNRSSSGKKLVSWARRKKSLFDRSKKFCVTSSNRRPAEPFLVSQAAALHKLGAKCAVRQNPHERVSQLRLQCSFI